MSKFSWWLTPVVIHFNKKKKKIEDSTLPLMCVLFHRTNSDENATIGKLIAKPLGKCKHNYNYQNVL